MKHVISLLLLFSTAASAEGTRFLGSHPLSAASGGGYCYVEVSHIHRDRPTPEFLFQEVDRQYAFTGDPSPFSYEGSRYVFYGHHPIATSDGRAVVYCFLDGTHYHSFAVPNDSSFVVRDGVAFYVGLFSPYFFQLKERVGRAINAFYEPYARLRPVTDVSPPPEWHGDQRLPPVTRTLHGSPDHQRLIRFHRDTSH